MVQIFKGKAVCPCCDGNGLIFRTRLKCNNLLLYVCDECDATWERPQDIDTIQGQCLGIILDEHGVGWENIECYEYMWLENSK